MDAIIDRFEGEYAVIEYNKEVFNLPKKILPAEVKEGDVLKIDVVIDVEKTKKLKQQMNRAIVDMFED